MHRRFVISLVLPLLFISAQAYAQIEGRDSSRLFNIDGSTDDQALSLDEYKNVPEGLIMPPEKKEAPVPVVKTDGTNSTIVSTSPNKMTFEGAIELYKTGKFEEVVQTIQPLAENGHMGSIELFGIMNRMGQGIPKNPTKAFQLLSQAAEANRPLAQHHLGIMYYLGEGTEKDPTRALMWLKIASLHYPDGPEKKRSIEDMNAIIGEVSRRERESSILMAKEWLDKKGEGHLIDLQ